MGERAVHGRVEASAGVLQDDARLDGRGDQGDGHVGQAGAEDEAGRPVEGGARAADDVAQPREEDEQGGAGQEVEEDTGQDVAGGRRSGVHEVQRYGDGGERTRRDAADTGEP
ncbi:hypothetical protein [Streptomyces virginiae]|uniref:hypothetical protein n=1 Tax=Streptomyces virginiae TaxID=1961 RepID=UPI00364863F3